MHEIKHPSGLLLTSTEDISREQWLTNRMTFIGGSDIGTILGLNKRFSPIELFYQKLGLDNSESGHNIYTATGTILEDKILEMGDYIDLDSQNWVENWENKTPLRKNVAFPYMVWNEKYPMFLANVDSLILDKLEEVDGMVQKAEAIGEAKTISRQSADQWEDRLPPYYISQVMTYMTVLSPMLREKFAVIFSLEAGLELTAFPIHYIDEYADLICEEGYAFWELLNEGRDIMANASDEEQMLRGLVEIEPNPDNTKAYDMFISERLKTKERYKVVDANESLLEHAYAYRKAHAELKKLTDKKQEATNNIKKFLSDNEAQQVNLNGEGKITFNKRLYVNFK